MGHACSSSLLPALRLVRPSASSGRTRSGQNIFGFALRPSGLCSARIQFWLGRRDSNPRMTGPEPAALPLGYAPTLLSILPEFHLFYPVLFLCIIYFTYLLTRISTSNMLVT